MAESMPDSNILQILAELPDTAPMPALFIGHGSPMNAISDNRWSSMWRRLGERLPRPKAIVCISAHWLTPGATAVTAMSTPKTIHDFGGFPQALFEQQYPAPGDPQLAQDIARLLEKVDATLDNDWGLDHGTWSVLLPMYPAADIPVVQVSIDYAKAPLFHYELATQLRTLRARGVLILGSGNIVHNLRAMRPDDSPHDWALEFDAVIADYVNTNNWRAAAEFQSLGPLARMAHPTYDHYLPLLYTLGVRDARDSVVWFNEGFTYGSISMRSFALV